VDPDTDQNAMEVKTEAEQTSFAAGYEQGKHEPVSLRLDTAQKVIITVIAVVTFLASTFGSYYVNKASVEFRLQDMEKRGAVMAAKVEQQETFGHPDHERRITKLEARADSSDKSIEDLNRKVDVATAILIRIEAAVNNIQAERRKP
jgi:hypothetical protein